MDIDKNINMIHEILALLKELPDPYSWANQFRDSYRQFQKGSESIEIVNACSKLSDSLYKLERDPSYFLYSVIPGKTLSELTDEELNNEEVLHYIESEVDRFMKDYQQLIDVFSSAESLVYKKLGNVIVELGKGLDKRNELLLRLSLIVKTWKQPEEIRQIGSTYLNLISTIQPLREAIRSFVDEYS